MEVDSESDSVDTIQALQPDFEVEQEEVGFKEVEEQDVDADKLKEVEADEKLEEASDSVEDEALLEEKSEDEEVEMFKMIDMYSAEEKDKDKDGEKETEEKKLGPSIPYRCV